MTPHPLTYLKLLISYFCVLLTRLRKEMCMGAKDMTEKYLESYNDVFADIVNVLLFRGERIMQHTLE